MAQRAVYRLYLCFDGSYWHGKHIGLVFSWNNVVAWGGIICLDAIRVCQYACGAVKRKEYFLEWCLHTECVMAMTDG